MDQETYQRWWPLHLRVARGAALTAEEQSVYEEGLAQLEAGERLDAAITGAQQARADVTRLEAEHAQLVAQREQLGETITALETALGQQTRP